jgi:splicing factor 3B subunit 3
LVYTTISGAVGALVPFASMDDVEFMTTLEMVRPYSHKMDANRQHMRTQNSSLVGRDHLAYRGYYAPVMGVIDGDLCESFGLLPYPQQQAIAEDLEDRSVPDVLKKLEQMRTSAAF